MERNKEAVVQSGSSQVLSFDSQLQAVMRKCEFEEAVAEDPHNARLYEQMCKIMTEVFRKDGNADVKIGRQTLKASKVQEVFEQVRSTELRFVADNVCAVSYKIKFVKAYLTTALYNSVFESELRIINDVNSDAKDGGYD